MILLLMASAALLPVPGSIDPGITQANIGRTVCRAGYTATIRPSTSYTSRLKAQQMRAGHLSGNPSEYEEDHRVPLALGGAPRDPRNLWPEPIGAALLKDRLETAIHRDLCSGRLSLAQAQAIFLGDYWAEYRRRFSK
jgi:hypothetical protein